jgi:hypothetical protein
MSRKLDRARYGPGWAEVTLGAVLAVALGVALAAAYFVFKPVVRVKELPKEPVAGMVYYIEGSRENSNARRLAAKEKLFVRGGSVVVNEDELNTAANPVAAPAPPAAPTAPTTGPAPEVPAVSLQPGPPSFRIRDGVMQITVPVRLRADLAYLDQTVLVQMKGTFVRQGDTFAFVPKTASVGSCPVERLPMAMNFVVRKFLYSQPIPEDIAKAWGRLADVTIEGSTLRLTMP